MQLSADGVKDGVHHGATDEISHKAALLRVRSADAPAFAADPALAWSAPRPWAADRRAIVHSSGTQASEPFYRWASEKAADAFAGPSALRATPNLQSPFFHRPQSFHLFILLQAVQSSLACRLNQVLQLTILIGPLTNIRNFFYQFIRG
jgi:hypothetical protein